MRRNVKLRGCHRVAAHDRQRESRNAILLRRARAQCTRGADSRQSGWSNGSRKKLPKPPTTSDTPREEDSPERGNVKHPWTARGSPRPVGSGIANLLEKCQGTVHKRRRLTGGIVGAMENRHVDPKPPGH